MRPEMTMRPAPEMRGSDSVQRVTRKGRAVGMDVATLGKPVLGMCKLPDGAHVALRLDHMGRKRLELDGPVMATDVRRWKAETP